MAKKPKSEEAPQTPETPPKEEEVEEVVATTDDEEQLVPIEVVDEPTPPEGETEETAEIPVTVTAGAGDDAKPEPEPEPRPATQAAALPEPDVKAFETARSQFVELQKQRDAVDQELSDLEVDMNKPDADGFALNTKAVLLASKRNRLDGRIQQAENTVNQFWQAIQQQQKQQQETAAASYWEGFGKTNKELGKSSAEVVKAGQGWWQEEVQKAVKAHPNQQAAFIQGVALARFEHRVEMARAKAIANKPPPNAPPAATVTKGATTVLPKTTQQRSTPSKPKTFEEEVAAFARTAGDPVEALGIG